MDGTALFVNDFSFQLHIFERLKQVPGYTWDESRKPYHSSYDCWHAFGTKIDTRNAPRRPQAHHTNTSGGRSRPSSSLTRRNTAGSDDGTASTSGSSTRADQDDGHTEVIAKLSFHALREERSFQVCKSLSKSVDPEGKHIARPLELLRLPAQQNDNGPLVIAIFEAPGYNDLIDYMDFGPAWYRGSCVGEEPIRREGFRPQKQIPIPSFLEFAVGAAECLELLHNGQRVVHGEIRGDAFHYAEETGQVRLISFGSGLRSFEHGLTSSGWSTLSREAGAKNKLCFISPEQTGRMPAEPDSRTDIYSLGILFWTLLTQEPAFEGETPMDIIQGVLGRRLPSVSSVRLDVPDVIGRIIQKMTSKSINDRYHSASGLKHDLREIERLLGDGDSASLGTFKIATKDISSYFILPASMIGREEEHDEIVKVIEKVAKRHLQSSKQGVHGLSVSSSSVSGREIDDTRSTSEESASANDRSSISLARIESVSATSHKMTASGPVGRAGSLSQQGEQSDASRYQGTAQARDEELSTTLEAQKSQERSMYSSSLSIEGESVRTGSEGVGSLASRKNNQKFSRKGRCEVISIAGAGGLGKSCLVQSMQVEARRRGYFASSKFDQARDTPFGPVLKLLSSLFRQVFSESDTDTQFHQALKQYVRPAWPMLHKLLGLPEFLLGQPMQFKSSGGSVSSGYNVSLRTGRAPRRRDVSPASSKTGSMFNSGMGSQATQDFLRTGSSTKSMRMMNTFLDVLRVFALHKFLCLCLDDLQFADDASLELITQLIGSRMKMVIILTYRPDEILPDRIKAIVEPPNAEGIRHLKENGVGLTRIHLKPLNEDEITRYVAMTLSRSEEEVLALVAIIQAKTGGNPFYMREMLEACYRSQSIYYDYKLSSWAFDIDRIFKQYTSDNPRAVLDGDSVSGRLLELPSASRSVLAWASLVGTSFSFELIQRLMSYEVDGDHSNNKSTNQMAHAQQETVAGLQAAIQAYILVATENDDRFRFSHDRYQHAAASLRHDTPLMHFTIVETLLNCYSTDEQAHDAAASHICEATSEIKKRVLHRQRYRSMLIDRAQASAESGARSTAIKFYVSCFALLQKDPWDESMPDVYYDETLQLYTRAAENYHYVGDFDRAMSLLDVVLSRAKTPIDKCPTWVLQSRVFQQRGNMQLAFESLLNCLHELGVDVDVKRYSTMEKCDAEFERLSLKLKSMDRNEIISKEMPTDTNLSAVGAVLTEAASAAFWSSKLKFYHVALLMNNLHLEQGAYPQSGLSFIYLGMVAVTRFQMVNFAHEMGTIAIDLMDKWQDNSSSGRGGTIYGLFLGHLEYPLSVSFEQLDNALEHTVRAGDRVSAILNFGMVAMMKFFGSENVADLESFCLYGAEEVPDWQQDCRGGTLLIAVRQACRALQGKTNYLVADDVMSDDSHNGAAYCRWVQSSMKDSDRPVVFYHSVEIAPLFLYGHYSRAVEIAEACTDRMDTIWSARNTRFMMFFHGLALAASVFSKEIHLNEATTSTNLRVNHELTLQKIQALRKSIVDWQAVNDANYLAWSKLLDAQICELKGEHGSALRRYEEALDHASVNEYVFEEALGNNLLAGFLLRRGGRRSAKAALREAVMLYRQFGAVGVAHYIEEQHSLLLQGPTQNTRVVDVAVQTDFAPDSTGIQYSSTSLPVEENRRLQPTSSMSIETKADRIGAWQGGSARAEAGSGLSALDMLDLTSILESSQIISSILSINQLLETMADLILSNCGGLASLAAIVVEEDDPPGWSVAASGDPENGARSHVPGLPLSETPFIAESVILYCTRFREMVFCRDLINDERFGNVSDAWLERNPLGKSVIALPITHGDKPLLGVLYLEGEPNSFTDRNLTVLGLLVNQIGISYSNALTLKAIEKVSASNVSMVLSQKQALAKAKEAESKAKIAEAEALRNVKLAEEAAKAKSSFLANVSHELRTPLNGVIGNSELLRSSGLTAEQSDMADSIRVSADLLLTVINDILDFSKMEADKMQLFITAFKPQELLKEIIRSVAYSNSDKKSRNVEVLQDINVPATMVYGDPVRIHQVLGNLIGNSLKFTESGSISIGAKVEGETSDHLDLTFWVKDTGIGIPQAQLAKLFKPFSQADASTARKYGGSGLGLSICKSLIESMMGGKIELNSIEGKGTTAWFRVRFPKASEQASEGDLPAGANEQNHRMHGDDVTSANIMPYNDFSDIPREELRICIAEDNLINQKIAIQFVQKLGFKHVDAYDNGLLAVEGLRAKAREGKPYHLLLCDVQMPVCDGYEATVLIRKDEIPEVRGILIIAMTASAIQGDREKCLESGMNDYLAKPVRVQVLRKKLDQYCGESPSDVPKNLQAEAAQVAKQVLQTAVSRDAASDSSAQVSPQRLPARGRPSTTD